MRLNSIEKTATSGRHTHPDGGLTAQTVTAVWVAVFYFTFFAELVQENGHLTTTCRQGKAVFLIGERRKKGGGHGVV